MTSRYYELGSTLRTRSNHSYAIVLRLSSSQWALRTHCVCNRYFKNTCRYKHANKSLCLFISLIFYIIRNNNALETTRKVSCFVICFLIFAKSKFFCNFSCCFCFSLWSDQLAGEDGCNSGYCFGTSESFVGKISVFSNMRFRWFIMS